MEEVPPEFDWRGHEIMDFPIRRQGEFGVCWSLAIADCIGCKLKLSDPNVKDFVLSPQHLVECVDISDIVEDQDIVHPSVTYTEAHITGKRQGEYTVHPSYVFTYCKHWGITLESLFPYEGKRCYNANDVPKVPRIFVADINHLGGASHHEIRRVIHSQPVLGFMFTYKSFRKWKGKGEEIYLAHQIGKGEQKSGHMVLVVGYGISQKNEEFFVIRNSWGEQWGDGGYAKVATSLVILGYYPTRVYIKEK